MAVRVLVVHYSRTGRSRAIAETLAAALNADIEEICEVATDRLGLRGFLRSGLDSILGRSTRIEPLWRDPSDYDLVVIGGPVWLHRASAPVRCFLRQESKHLLRTVLFVTYDWRGAEAALREMRRLARSVPISQFRVRTTRLASDGAAREAREFARGLLARFPELEPAPRRSCE